jgi:hypothetical protein
VNYFTLVSAIFPLPSQDLHLTGLDFAAPGGNSLSHWPFPRHRKKPIARDALVAEAGLDVAIAPNASLGVSWTGQFADQSHDNAAKEISAGVSETPQRFARGALPERDVRC